MLRSRLYNLEEADIPFCACCAAEFVDALGTDPGGNVWWCKYEIPLLVTRVPELIRLRAGLTRLDIFGLILMGGKSVLRY